MNKNMRAWYLEDAEYKDQEMPKFNLVVTPDESAIFVMEKDTDFQYNMEVPFLDDGWVVEYSTGLLDKNGIEIFEGDIISVETQSFFDNTVFLVNYRVGWDESGASWWMERCGFHGKSSDLGESFGFGAREVIGNIHQNKDLDKPN